jgi:hypothetical protein
MIDLLALAAVERETEMTYIRKERDWAERARSEGRLVDPGRLLPVLPSAMGAGANGGNGTAHGGNGTAHDH